MSTVIKGLAAAALAVTLATVGLPGGVNGGGGMTLSGTGSTGCCKQ